MNDSLSYRFLGGEFPITAAMRNAAANIGLTNPHSHKPFSEAMMLGLGGGIGFGYILWEFENTQSGSLVLGLNHHWNYPEKFAAAICRRAGFSFDFQKTAGAKKAESQLFANLNQGLPVICWTDTGGLPFLHVAKDLKSCYGHVTVVVPSADNQHLEIDDRAKAPFHISHESLREARAAIPSYKHRLLTLKPDQVTHDLKPGIRAGLEDCLARLGGSSGTFSLKALRKWARALASDKDAKAWVKVFSKRRGLGNSLMAIFETITCRSRSGGALRPLFADFLEEAGQILDTNAFEQARQAYQTCANKWNQFAKMVIPEALAEGRQWQQWARDKQTFLAEGPLRFQETAVIANQIETLRSQWHETLPLSWPEIQNHFHNMADMVEQIWSEETEALAQLRDAYNSLS